MEQQLELMEEYDGTIKASETVGRKDILIGFYPPLKNMQQRCTGLTFGWAVAWKPRKKELIVRQRTRQKRHTLEKKLVKYALQGTENGDRDKLRVEWR